MRRHALAVLLTLSAAVGCTAILGDFDVSDTNVAVVPDGGSSEAGPGGGTDAAPAPDAAPEDAGCRPPENTGFLEDAVQVAAGATHTCAIRVDGSLWCWGANAVGELGVPLPQTLGTHRPVKVAFPPELGAARIVQVAASEKTTFAVDSELRLWAWGSNTSGLLANGQKDVTDIARPMPQIIRVGGAPMLVRSVAPMWYAACALTPAGDVMCWGQNSQRELGPDVPAATSESLTPVKAFGFSAAPLGDAILGGGTGSAGSCYTRGGASQVRCWGSGAMGLTLSPNAVPVNNDAQTALQASGARLPLRAIEFGTNYGAALDDQGQLLSWGNNNNQSIHGPTAPAMGTAALTPGPFRALASAYVSLCVIDQQGVVQCRGSNTQLQLGRPNGVNDLDSDPNLRPVVGPNDAGLAPATELGAGFFHVCAIMAGRCGPRGGGSVVCWGANEQGQLGAPPGRPARPQRVVAP